MKHTKITKSENYIKQKQKKSRKIPFKSLRIVNIFYLISVSCYKLLLWSHPTVLYVNLQKHYHNDVVFGNKLHLRFLPFVNIYINTYIHITMCDNALLLICISTITKQRKERKKKRKRNWYFQILKFENWKLKTIIANTI